MSIYHPYNTQTIVHNAVKNILVSHEEKTKLLVQLVLSDVMNYLFGCKIGHYYN